MATIADSIDISDFEPNCTDKEKIGSTRGQGVPCRICWAIFGRLRITWRYCAGCEAGYCEG